MSDFDDDGWQELIKDIKKIPSDNRIKTEKKIVLKVTPKITPNLVYNGELLTDLQIDNFSNIDANTAQRFRKGEFRLEAELDLHGYTEDRAFDAVISFVKKAYLNKKRCISIITGKGLRKKVEDDIFDSRGVLKDRVPQWLNLPELRPLILAIKHPLANEGGSGAIHIFLRRQRA